MRLKLDWNHPAAPFGPVVTNALSALEIDVEGAPARAASVSVAVFNAEGALMELAAKFVGDVWRATFPASHFEAYGDVAHGVFVDVGLADESGVVQDTRFAGDIKIKAVTPGVREGGGVVYERRGADIYQPTYIDAEDRQHYARQELSWDDDMQAWSADWTGDYILRNGVFTPSNEGGEQ